MKIPQYFLRQFLFFLLIISVAFAQNKIEIYQQDHPEFIESDDDILARFEDRKRSVLDKGNLVLRLSNAAVYGYDRWGLCHEFPSGSMTSEGCCTYYWTASPIVGALVNGQPSVAVGVRGSYRDSEEEFEPLPGYDSGVVSPEENIGIAFSDLPQSWPLQWPREMDPTGTFESIIYNSIGNPIDTFYFPEIEPDLVDGFPDSPCGVGIKADREAYFVVTDNDPASGNIAATNTVGPLNVRIDIWVLNFTSTYGNDGLIFLQKMTNVGADTLKDLYFGVTGDPDAPEQGSAEWTDDMALFIEPNDPHIAEKLIDTTDAAYLENLALVYDMDDKSEGFKSENVGWIGWKFLDCIKYNADGSEQSYGLSTFQTYPYSDDANNDGEAYNSQLAAGIQAPDYIDPNPNDVFQKPYSYGDDITWVIASGPMDVAPGEQVLFAFADFVGTNESDVLRNARFFQKLYDNDCSVPRPPDPPVVYSVAGDGQVFLYWDGEASESSVDEVTGCTDCFEGYRIYRSMNGGNSWGTPVTDFQGTSTDLYQPLAIFDINNEFSGSFPLSDPQAYYDLGSNSGLQYSYIDNNIINGLDYQYAVCAFDRPDDWDGEPVDPMENARQKDPDIAGDNTIAVIPNPPPTGYSRQLDLNHISGYSDADLKLVNPNPFDYDVLNLIQIHNNNILDHEYEITFDYSCGEPFTDINGDGVCCDGDETYMDLNGNEQWDEAIFDSQINQQYWSLNDLDAGEILVELDTAITSSEAKYIINGFIPIWENAEWTIEGIKNSYLVENLNPETEINIGALGSSSIGRIWADYVICPGVESILDCDGNCFTETDLDGILGNENPDFPFLDWCADTPPTNVYCEEFNFDFGDCDTPPGFELPACVDDYREPGRADNTLLRLDLEFRFTELGSFASYYYENGSDGLAEEMVKVPFELWVVEEFDYRQVQVAIFDPGENIGSGSLFIEDSINLGSYQFTRSVFFAPLYEDYDMTLIPYVDADSPETAEKIGWVIKFDDNTVWEIGEIYRVEFLNPIIPEEDIYRITTQFEEWEVEEGDLDVIRVVPNPFKITSLYQNNIEEKEIQFHYLPNKCVIRIYNLAGDLVRLIKHDIGEIGYRSDSIHAWNLRTYNDQEVAFGVYFYHIMADGIEKTGKFALIK